MAAPCGVNAPPSLVVTDWITNTMAEPVAVGKALVVALVVPVGEGVGVAAAEAEVLGETRKTAVPVTCTPPPGGAPSPSSAGWATVRAMTATKAAGGAAVRAATTKEAL